MRELIAVGGTLRGPTFSEHRFGCRPRPRQVARQVRYPAAAGVYWMYVHAFR